MCSALPGTEEGSQSVTGIVLAIGGVCFPGGKRLVLSPDCLLWPSFVGHCFQRTLLPSPGHLRSVVHKDPAPKRRLSPLLQEVGMAQWLDSQEAPRTSLRVSPAHLGAA